MFEYRKQREIGDKKNMNILLLSFNVCVPWKKKCLEHFWLMRGILVISVQNAKSHQIFLSIPHKSWASWKLFYSKSTIFILSHPTKRNLGGHWTGVSMIKRVLSRPWLFEVEKTHAKWNWGRLELFFHPLSLCLNIVFLLKNWKFITKNTIIK